WTPLLRTLYVFYYKRRIDTMPSRHKECREELYRIFNESLSDKTRWYEIYNLLEYILQNIEELTSDINWHKNFERTLNSTLEREGAGYRAINGEIVPITAAHEVEAIRQAAGASSSLGLDAVREHIDTALHLLGKKPDPDYRNSIKESISAVESICKLL